MTIETEYNGKDLEEAINNACQSLNLSREQLNIKVSSPGSNGIFGLLRKKAIIQVTPKNSKDAAKQEKTSNKKGRPSEAPLGDIKLFSKKAPGKEKFTRPTLPKPPRIESSLPSKEVSPEILSEIQSSTGKILELMGYHANISLSQERGKVLVQISGDQIENIIGEEGNTLDALQYLVRKIVSQKFSEKIMLSMDAGDFRENRKKELQELALEMARIVKEGKKHRIIAPLNPAERRIIHVTLQTDTTIRSKSLGEGLFKKIKIYLPGQVRKSQGRRRSPQKQQPSTKE